MFGRHEKGRKRKKKGRKTRFSKKIPPFGINKRREDNGKKLMGPTYF